MCCKPLRLHLTGFRETKPQASQWKNPEHSPGKVPCQGPKAMPGARGQLWQQTDWCQEAQLAPRQSPAWLHWATTACTSPVWQPVSATLQGGDSKCYSSDILGMYLRPAFIHTHQGKRNDHTFPDMLWQHLPFPSNMGHWHRNAFLHYPKNT